MSSIHEHKKGGDETVAAPPATETVVLLAPIKIAGVATSRLTMRRPKLRDIKALGIRNFYEITDDEARKLIGNLCEVDPEELLDLDFADWNTLQVTFQGMVDFPRGRK